MEGAGATAGPGLEDAVATAGLVEENVRQRVACQDPAAKARLTLEIQRLHALVAKAPPDAKHRQRPDPAEEGAMDSKRRNIERAPLAGLLKLQHTGAAAQAAAVVVCCLSADRKSVLILHRGEGAPWCPSTWSLPGGAIDDGEAQLEAAVRELREETGLEATGIDPLGGRFRLQHPGDDVVQAFVCVPRDTGRLGSSSDFPGGLPVSPELGYPENDAWRWVSLSEALCCEQCTPDNVVLIRHALSAAQQQDDCEGGVCTRGGSAGSSAHDVPGPAALSLARTVSNHDRSGDEQGLFNVDFSITEGEGLRTQGDLDRELSEVWRTADASEIRDTTRETVGADYDVFTGKRFNLVKYEKTEANAVTGKFEPPSGQNQFVVLDNVLGEEQCKRMHELVTQKWKPIEPRYRESDVYVLNAPLLSKEMERRLQPFVPDSITDEFGQTWDLVGANNGFFRLISYVNDKRDKYPMHYDLPGNRLDSGVLPGCQDDETRGRRSEVAKTMLTFNMYLNGSESFGGGIFSVFESPSSPWFTIEPRAGRAFLFRQGQTKGYLHDAGAIDLSSHPGGHKSIVRIDFVYRRRGSPAPQMACMTTCKFCPERFADQDAASLHVGIHDNPVTPGYEEWKRRLDATFATSKKTALERTQSEGRRAAVMGL